MPRLIKSPNSGSTIVNAVTPAQGGHGEVTAIDALEAMDLVPRNSIGKFGRPIPLDGDGYIDQRYLQDLYATMETVSGDLTIEVNQTKEYFLTGYDAFSVYDVRAVSGMVSVDRNVITYTAPGEPGQGGFTINGRTVAVTVTEVNVVEGIAPPVMLTPVRGTAGLTGPVSVTSSAFVTDNAETHASTSWQCAEDPGFTVIVASVDQSTVHKTSWSIGTVMLGKHYFIRARYHGSGGGVSPWSEETHFTSPVPTPADRPVITSPVNGAARLPSRVTLTSSTYNTVTGDPHVSTSWEISESPLFTNLAFQNINSAVDKTSWMVSGLQPAKEYYARVRYRGQLHEYTEWSPTSAFRTRLAFLPETEIGKSGTYNGVSADMDDTGGRWIVGNGSFSTPGVNCAAYIYRRDGGVPVLEDTIQAVAGQKNMVTTIPAGGQLEVTVNGRYTSTKSYTQAEEIIVPAGAQTLTLVGKGSSSNEVTAFVIGNGSVQIPAGTTSLKLIGKGSDGTTVYDPGQPAAPGGTITLTESISGAMNVPNTFASITIGHNGTDYTCPDVIDNLAFMWYGTPRYDITYTRGVADFSDEGDGTFIYDIFYGFDSGGAGSAGVRFQGRASASAVKPQPYIAPSTTTTNGISATMTIQGQTYTYPGGIGGPATPRTDNIALNGTAQTLSYSIPTGGSGQYGYPGSAGVSQSLAGTGEYIFPLGTPKVSITAKGGDGSMTTTGIYDDALFKTESRKVNISISPLMYAGYESDDGYFLLYGGYSNGHSYSVTTPLPSSTVFHFRKDLTYLLSVEDLPDTITITGPNGTGGTITKTLRANFQGLHVFVSTTQGIDPLGFGLQYREAGGGSGFYVNLSFTTIDIRDTTEAKDTYLNKQSWGYSWIRQPSSLVAYGENNPYNAATLTYLKVSIGDRLFNFSQPGGGWGDLWCVKVSRKEIIFATYSTTTPYFPTDATPDIYHQGNSVRWTTTDCWVESSLTPVAVQGQPSTFTIQGITKTFPGGNGGPATVTTQEITLDGSDLSMNYSIPATGSGVVQYSVSTVYSNSFTGNGSHNVPADVTTVSITGRGQDGTPAITEQWEYPEKTSEVHYFITGPSGSIGNVYPPVVSLTNPPVTIIFNQGSPNAETGTYARTFTETVNGVERKVVEYIYGYDGGGSGWITYTVHYRAYKVNVLLPQPAKWVNPVPYVPDHVQGKPGTLRYHRYDPPGFSTDLFTVTGKIYLTTTSVTPEEYVDNTLPLMVTVHGTYVVRDSSYPDNTGPILDHGTWGYAHRTDVDVDGNLSQFHYLYFSSIPMQVSGSSGDVFNPEATYHGIDVGNYFLYTNPSDGSIYTTLPGASYTFQAATPDLRTPATTGTNTVVTFNGQTYTYPGGVGGPATSRNDIVSVTAGSIKPLNYTVPQGGVVSLSYTTAVTPARETTATINGQTYTFSGSNTGAATNTTYTLSLVDNNAFANAVAMNQDGTLAAICSSPKIGSTAGYVLVLQRSGTSWNIVDELNRIDGLVWHAQSVSMDKTGNYILVGADAQPVGASKIGSFAIYRRQAGKYAVEQTVIAPDPGVAYEAGSSVSLSGNASIAVIGAPAGGVASRTLVYERDNDNTLVLTATLSKTTDPHSEDSFGTRVYISADGSTIAASSPTSRGVNTTHANCGEVIIFRKVDNVWTQVSTVRHPTPATGLYFGQDLHLSDDGFTLSVGVPGGTGGLGEVMFFDIEGSTVTYKSNVVSSAVTGGTNFGKAIALPGHSGDLVGASKFGTYVFD